MSDSKQTEELKQALYRTSPKSGKLWDRAQSLYPGGEISAVRTFDPWPFYATRGQGAYVWDVDGNRYIDCCMCYGVLLLGHRPEPIIRALSDQLARGIHYGAPLPEELDFAEKFIRCVPCAERVILCNSGNEAVHKSIAIARAFTGRDKVAKFEGGFHGSNEYSMWSAKHLDPQQIGPEEQPNLLPEAAGFPRAAKDAMVLLPYGREKAFEIIEENASDLALVMLEPVFGSGAFHMDISFLRKLREVTQRCGVLLLFDEIITGFRLALGGGQELLGVIPDIGIFGKALGGGLPIGAIGTSVKIVDRVINLDPPLSIAGTFSGNAMTIAAGNAMLDYLMANRHIYEDLAEKGDYLRTEFNAFAKAKGLPGTMTGIGSMWQVYLTPNPVTKPRDRMTENLDALRNFELMLRLEGVFIPSPLHLAFISPAHSADDIETILAALKRSLQACFSG